MLKKILFTVCLSLLFMNSSYASNQSELTITTNYSLLSIDPYSQINQESLQLSNLLFDSLTRWENFVIENHLLKNLTRIDDFTWRGTLRDNITFHSGNQLTTEDVVWSFDRAKQSPSFAYVFSNIKEIKIVDSYTIDFITLYPTVLLPDILTNLFIMDKNFYQGTDVYGHKKDRLIRTITSIQPENDPFPFAWNNASGSGAFMLYKLIPGISLELNSFNNYWKKQGNIQKLILNRDTDYSRVTYSLLSYQADCVLPLPISEAFRITHAPNINLHNVMNSKIFIIQFNFNKSKVLNNIKIREALVAATDNNAISKNILSEENLATQQFAAPNQLGYIKDLPERYNLEKARRLIEEAGYTEKNPLILNMAVLDSPRKTNKRIVASFVSMMQQINANINIIPMSEIEYFNARKVGSEADLLFATWKPDTEDTTDYFQNLLMCKDENNPNNGDFNFGSYCNKQLDQIIDTALNTADKEKRNQLLTEATKITYDDVAFIPIAYAPFLWSSNKKILNAEDIINRANIIYFGKALLQLE